VNLCPSARPVRIQDAISTPTGLLEILQKSTLPLYLRHTFLKIDSWLEEKVLAVDACFKLSQKGGAKSRSDNDPELTSGHGVFVNEDEYQSILKKNSNLVQVKSRAPVQRSVSNESL
jgi:hypothetical protein